MPLVAAAVAAFVHAENRRGEERWLGNEVERNYRENPTYRFQRNFEFQQAREAERARGVAWRPVGADGWRLESVNAAPPRDAAEVQDRLRASMWTLNRRIPRAARAA